MCYDTFIIHVERFSHERSVFIVEKRKDKNGRVLKTGEYQRKNGTYVFRYSAGHGQVHSAYAKTLDLLRIKEENIRRDISDGIDYAAGEITVSELVDRYMNLKQDLSENSRRGVFNSYQPY